MVRAVRATLSTQYSRGLRMLFDNSFSLTRMLDDFFDRDDWMLVSGLHQ
jgi:hypothetical protein